MLSVDDEEENNELLSDRVIVEHFFGRMNGLWEVTSRNYRWAEEFYDPILHLCVGLTNTNIFWHPLRDQDRERYQLSYRRRSVVTRGEQSEVEPNGQVELHYVLSKHWECIY